MALEDVSAYSNIANPDSLYIITTNKVEANGIDRATQSWVADDKGVDHFSGDFEHLLEVRGDSSSDADVPIEVVWGLANIIGDRQDIIDASGDLLACSMFRLSGAFRINLQERNAGSATTDNSINLSANTIYYLAIERDESVGNGTIYCYIYSDQSRLTLEDTLAVILTEKEDFRYIYASQSYANGVGQILNAWMQNLDLQEAVAVGNQNLLLMGVG